MAIQTVSGPAEISIYSLDNAGAPTGSPIVISSEQQLEDATLAIQVTVFEHQTQSSASPYRRIQTGFGADLTVSIADVTNFDLISLVLGATATGSGANKAISLSDNAGLDFPGKFILIKPYDGPTVSTSALNWFSMPYAQIYAQNFNYAYGLQTQQAITLTASAMPDAAGRKVIKGNPLTYGITLPGGSPSPSPVSYNTTITGSNTSAGVTVTTSGSPTFSFNSISSPTGTPIDMTLRIGTTDVAVVTYPSAYAGAGFRFVNSGTTYNSTFRASTGTTTLT